MEEVIQVNIYNGLDQDSSLSVLVIYSTGQAISPAVNIGLIRWPLGTEEPELTGQEGLLVPYS